MAKQEDKAVDNLELWHSVEKTNPKYTKKAKVGGNEITAISPQFQIMNATEKFGSYGEKWGFKKIEFDYSITNTPVKLSVQDWTTKKTEIIDSILGLVGFKATFFFPNGEFEITNSIKIFTDNKHSKIDDNFAKKLETDALTKALSKLGFNADIFLGKFDDVRYVEDMNKEFTEKEKHILTENSTQWNVLLKAIEDAQLLDESQFIQMYQVSEELKNKLNALINTAKENRKPQISDSQYESALKFTAPQIKNVLAKFRCTEDQSKNLMIALDTLEKEAKNKPNG